MLPMVRSQQEQMFRCTRGMEQMHSYGDLFQLVMEVIILFLKLGKQSV